MRFILLLITVMATTLYAKEIKIAVAANVSYAMDDIKKAFYELHPQTKVEVTLGSSGKLTAQISNGAPYQLFIAANMIYPETLYKKGMAVTKPLVYAQGALAYFSSKKTDFSKGIKGLEDTKIKRVALANPKTAPYGKASLEALRNGNVYKKVTGKLVYAESVSQTVTYVITAADVGFVAKSSLYSPKMARFKENENWCEVESSLYTPIDQGIVILKEGKANPEVKAFYDFILSKKAQEIFRAYGYTTL